MAAARAGGRPANLNPFKREVRRLHPAYFAMVMATGIVAIAAHLLGMDLAAAGLTALNVVAYVVLWTMTVARLALFPRDFLSDALDHNRGVGFFTIVAGTAVLGSEMLLYHHAEVAVALWILSLLLWLVFTYGIFVGFTVGENKPTLAEGINGGWLIAVVATQAVAELGTLLLSDFPSHQQGILFLCLSLWLCGGMLYIWMISLIFYRYTFYHFAPSDLMPPYWINMGAMAISTLAGAALIAKADRAAFLQAILPFLKGFTVFFWATATWWIPMLLLLGIWRHVIKKFKLSYDPLYWGGCFLSACTRHALTASPRSSTFLSSSGFLNISSTWHWPHGC